MKDIVIGVKKYHSQEKLYTIIIGLCLAGHPARNTDVEVRE
jgi:hypothetical protein